MKFSDGQIEMLMEAVMEKRIRNDQFHREEHGNKLHPKGEFGLASCPKCPRSAQHNLLTSIWNKLSDEQDARRS